MLQNLHAVLTFNKVQDPLCLPRKTTSKRPKVLRTPQVLSLLTSKCASRHNGVHFFNMSTSKSAPSPSVFNTFDLAFFLQSRKRFFKASRQKVNVGGTSAMNVVTDMRTTQRTCKRTSGRTRDVRVEGRVRTSGRTCERTYLR